MPTSPERRAAILDAALDLFVERGFHGTPVPLVAARAGVSVGTLYRLFPSKEQLVNELYRHWKQAIAVDVATAALAAATPRQQFHQLWHRLFAFAAAHPRAFAFLEFHFHGSYLDEASRAMEDRVIDLASALLRRLQRDEAIKPMPVDVLMPIVYFAFVGLVRYGRDGKLQLDAEAIAAGEQCVWEAIRH